MKIELAQENIEAMTQKESEYAQVLLSDKTQFMGTIWAHSIYRVRSIKDL